MSAATNNCPKCERPLPAGRAVSQCPACLLGATITSVGGEESERAGPYQLSDKIGEGAFGEVFFGEQHEPMHREAAVKILKRDSLKDASLLARFRAEASALTRLDHPNIARLYEAGSVTDGRPFIALELISGTPITDWCTARELDIGDRLALFGKVCHAMQHAHERGLVHRDLKPANILVDLDSGEPKVIDFGVARTEPTALQNDAMLTGAGDIIGTPAYLSPEQTDGNAGNIDARSDVYALGVVLYELLTGRTPLDATDTESHFKLLQAVRETPAEPPSRHNPTVSPALDATVLKALAKDRDERFQTAAELAAALNGDAPPSPRPSHTRAIAWTAVALAIAALVFILNKPPEPAPSTPSPSAESVLANFQPPFELIDHDHRDIGENPQPPFSEDSSFDWFLYRDAAGKDLLFAAEIDHESDASGQFIVGVKAGDLPGGNLIPWGSGDDRALADLLQDDVRTRFTPSEIERIEKVSWDDVANDRETRMAKLFLRRVLTLASHRKSRERYGTEKQKALRGL